MEHTKIGKLLSILPHIKELNGEKSIKLYKTYNRDKSYSNTSSISTF